MSNPSTPLPPPAPASPPRAAAPAQSTHKPLQFSMRTLMFAVTFFAIFAALLSLVGLSPILTLIIIPVVIAVPISLGTLALYCRGHRQTYFVGAFAGALSTYVIAGPALADDLLAILLMPLLAMAVAAIGGLVAQGTRRFLERRGWHLPPNHDDSAPGA